MIKVQNAILRHPEFRFSEPVSFNIDRDEQLVFFGQNGAGKSVIAQMIIGRYPLREGTIIYGFSPSPVYENIKFIAFRDTYGVADSSYYLQQRWNSQDRDESPTVAEVLGTVSKETLPDKLHQLFDLDAMLGKQLVLLSSGEMRKFQLTKALIERPRILIIDNPFIGLDKASRRQLSDLFDELAATGSVQLILLLSKEEEIPNFITHVIPVDGMRCHPKVPRNQFHSLAADAPVFDRLSPPSDAFSSDVFAQSDNQTEQIHSETVIELRKVSIRYGERTILDSLSWTVRRGERWALLGANGSGKSTLLSLVCADNPQSYACDISLFGTRRGTGESIWDIKKRIGYVSPEMHRAYSENLPAIEIVASGLYDTVGLYRRPRTEQFSLCEWWMNLLGISALKHRSFLCLSDGEQRLILLARAFVKDPELLILDEPMHGLDENNRQRVKSLIEAFAQRQGKTLIMVTHYEEDLPEGISQRLCLPSARR